MPSDTQMEVTRESGPPVEVRVTYGGLKIKIRESMEMEEFQERMTILNYVVIGGLTIYTIILYFSEEEPEEVQEVYEQQYGAPMRDFTRYVLQSVVNKDVISVEDVRDNQEEVGIYEIESKMDGDEYNEL